MKIKSQLIIVVVLWLLALPAVLWIDRPLALAIHHAGIDNYLLLRYVTEGLPPLMMWLLVIAALYRGWQLRWWLAIVYSGYLYVMLKVTMEVKTGLKIIFGRYWTKTWINNNLSLIHDNVFGFNWWHGHGNQGCFPSGHSTFTAFCCVWLWYLFPRFRYLWLSLMIIMPVCLIALDYHFLGDCLAGLGLGMFCAVLSYQLWQMSRGITIKMYKPKDIKCR